MFLIYSSVFAYLIYFFLFLLPLFYISFSLINYIILKPSSQISSPSSSFTFLLPCYFYHFFTFPLFPWKLSVLFISFLTICSVHFLYIFKYSVLLFEVSWTLSHSVAIFICFISSICTKKAVGEILHKDLQSQLFSEHLRMKIFF